MSKQPDPYSKEFYPPEYVATGKGSKAYSPDPERKSRKVMRQINTRGRTWLWMILGGLIALIAVAGIVIGLYLLFRGESVTPDDGEHEAWLAPASSTSYFISTTVPV